MGAASFESLVSEIDLPLGDKSPIPEGEDLSGTTAKKELEIQ